MHADAIYRELGKYIVCFQHLENLILEIICCLDDPNLESEPRLKYVGMRFGELVNCAESSLIRYSNKVNMSGRDDFEGDLRGVMQRCRKLAKNRNKLIHSTFVHLEAGGQVIAILRSYMKKDVRTDGLSELEFDREELDERSFDEGVFEIAKLTFVLGFLHRQLILWEGNPAPRYENLLHADTYLFPPRHVSTHARSGKERGT